MRVRLTKKFIFPCVFDAFFENVFFYPHGRRTYIMKRRPSEGLQNMRLNGKRSASRCKIIVF